VTVGGVHMKRKSLPVWLGIFALGVISSYPPAAKAADVAMPVKPIAAPALDAWTVTLAPYVWTPSLNGSTTVKGRTRMSM
jgi:hypothetical protein